MRELIERLEKSTGPDRELDWRIAETFEIPERWPTSALWPPFMPKSKYDKSIPTFTASIDAAVALAERALPGWRWEAGSDNTAVVYKGSGNLYFGATPAIALCIAILRAAEESAG